MGVYLLSLPALQGHIVRKQTGQAYTQTYRQTDTHTQSLTFQESAAVLRVNATYLNPHAGRGTVSKLRNNLLHSIILLKSFLFSNTKTLPHSMLEKATTP